MLLLLACQNPAVDVLHPDGKGGDSGEVADSGGGGGDSGGDSGVDAPVPASPAVHVIVEPSDDGAALIAAIRGATTSVHMTMYILTNDDVVSALAHAKGQGCDVRVVLDPSYNSSAYDDLVDLDIDVVWSPPAFVYTHQKTVIVDGDEAWIMTANASNSGLESNREFLAVDTDPTDVADAEAVFEADYAGSTYPTYDGRLVLSPLNSRDRLEGLIDAATTSILVEDEEFTDDDIAAQLAAKAQAGVDVRMVLGDGTMYSSQDDAVHAAQAGGARVVVVGDPYIHAKAIVIDGVEAYVGSENLSWNSLENNRELGVIFADPDEVATVQSTVEGDFATGVDYP